MKSKLQSDFPICSFKNQKDWHRWLDKNHDKQNGVWMHLYKKDSGVKTISRAEALEEALCYGWIDGQAKNFDEQSWLQKFTPRRAGSIWSKINIAHVTRLDKEGRMKPPGIKAVEDARQDGRLERAYDSPSTMQVPEDFLKELSKNKKALAFFKTLNKTNLFAINWRLQTAKKPETREKRKKAILEMLKKGEKFH